MANSAFRALTVLTDITYPGGFVEIGVGVPVITGEWQATPVEVAYGGTGNSTFTAYSIICAGTTSTGIFQNVSGVGTNGQVLTSSGAAALPTWQTPTTGTVTSVSGTANRITSTGGATPVIDISAAYVGQSSITTLGTISTGVWNGTVVTSVYGGSGVASPTIHGILIAQGSSPYTSSVLSAGQVLIGTTASDPAAATIAGTSNQITVTSSSGSIVASLPSAVIFPGTVTLNANPTASLEAATKQYVDSIASGLQIQASCYAGTTANLNATYLNGVSGVGATLTNAGALAAFSVDGASPPINSRILIKNQTAALQNGIYILSTVGSGAIAWILTRTTTYDQPSEISPGDFVLLDNGSTLQYTAWIQTATVTAVGTDPISFTQFGASNVITVSGTTNRITSSGGTSPIIDISASYVGQASITTLGTVATGVWNGTVVTGTYGGTGVNNGASTITLGGSLTTSGAFASTFTMTGVTGVTFPTSGTLATTAQLPSPAALTKGDDTNVTLTLGGTPATALLQAASITAGWTGTLGLTRGGTAASLVASNGGIVYSGAAALAILSGTATANQILMSGTSAAPAWSTATYPATTTANQLLYSSATNTVGGLATGNNGVLVTSAGGAPSISSTIPNATQDNITRLGTVTSGVWNGTAITVANGGTGNTTFTAYSVICAGTSATGIFQNVSGLGTSGQVLTSGGAGALPVWSNPTAGTIVNQNASSVTMVAGNQYFINNGASLVTLTLPTVAAQGDTFIIVGGSSGGWKVAQNASQTINLNSTATTTGTGGSLQNTNQYNCITIKCITANTTYVVSQVCGVITVV